MILVHPTVLQSPHRIAVLELRTGLRALWADNGRHAVLAPLPRPPRHSACADVTDVSDYIGEPPKGAA